MTCGPPKWRPPVFPVADDFAAIARRLKEIQSEAARETATAEKRRQSETESRPEAHDACDDMSTCV